MNTTTPNTETPNAEPCPYCGTLRACGPYIERPDLAKPGSGMAFAPADVSCDCGALLRHAVPLFKMSATGWVWRRIDPPAKATKPEPEEACETCGHSKESHGDFDGKGRCYHGSGNGNTCPCSKYVPSGEVE